jgi:hypothetical protein
MLYIYNLIFGKFFLPSENTSVQEVAAGKLRGDVASPTSPRNAPVETTCLDKSGVWLWCADRCVSLPDRSSPPYMSCSNDSKWCWKLFYVGFTLAHCRCAYQSALGLDMGQGFTSMIGTSRAPSERQRWRTLKWIQLGESKFVVAVPC